MRREKRGRRENPKTLDPIGEDGLLTGKDGKGFYACYILTSLSPRHKGHTYIGFTVNPKRRIRQHNGEITSGAYRTKKKRPWEMVLCIYGFPTNVSALQFEWAWQHPRESLAVREAAAAFKSFSGLASNVKLAYTMLSLPAWNSLNLTVNYFSSKYAHLGGLSPSLPPHMEVHVCPMDDLPCFTKEDDNSQPEDEESLDSNEEEDDDDSSNQNQPGNPTSSYVLDRVCEKAKGPETVHDDRLANFTGFGLLLDESDEDEVPYSTVLGSFKAMEKEPDIVFNDRLANFTGFGVEKIVEDKVSHSTMEKDCWRRSNSVTSTTKVEVIDLMTPSPTCRVRSSMKRPRVSEFIDLTRSPNFIEL
ncbi:Excinuclease ABC [Hirschfeldia incana]|nr:Excinuclease ABC [Hirschfeldia incana]